jgi:hypothetical protein
VFDAHQLDQLLDGRVDEIEAAEYQLPGFNKFRLYRRGSEQYYFLCIVINPQVLLTNRPTIDLFFCNQEAVQALEEAKDGSLSSTTIINEILEKLQELK